MDDWLPGFERIDNAKATGGTYVSGVPWRFVGHTTEVVPTSLTGARSLARRHEFPPHLWAWPEKGWKAQTVPLNRAAFALKHPAGTPETNKMRAIQCEVIGFAKDMPSKPEEFWDWLGVEVLASVVAAGYPVNLSLVAPTTGSDGAGVNGKVRFSDAEWRAFDGVGVHANVPHNDHWDMGRAPLAHMAAAAARTLEDDDMFTDEDRRIQRRIHDALGLAGLDDTKARGNIKGRVDALYADMLSVRDGVDVGELAAAIVAGMDDDLAEKVADVLASRLAG